MLGRFTSRRIVAPEPVSAPDAVPAAAAPALAPEAPSAEPEPAPELNGRGGPISEKLPTPRSACIAD